MAQTNVYSVKGGVSGTVDVPAAFETPYRPDIIKKAVLAAAANSRQPYGPAARSGMRHSVSTWGKGRGTARVQRVHDGRKATESPNNVSGRRAHPPRPERNWAQKVNKKELKIARQSALAATACAECVRARGHQFDDSVSFPIVVEDDMVSLKATSEVVELFEKVDVTMDDVREALELIRATDSVKRCLARAEEYVDQAIRCLDPVPDSIYKNSLLNLAHYIVSRDR